MITQLVLVAQLSTCPMQKSPAQTEHIVPLNTSIESMKIDENFSQTTTFSYDAMDSLDITLVEIFNSMKDLSENELNNYKNLISQKKKIVRKSIL